MSRDDLLALWNRLQAAEWFQQLPPWMREPPGVYVAAGTAVLLVFVLLFLLWYLLRGAPKPRKNRFKEVLRSERRELDELERNGNWLVLGERYELAGKTRQALDAYRRGGCHAELAKLLLASGKHAEAKEAARSGKVWGFYADLAEADGEIREAAEAWERAEQPLKAARCYERAELRHEAAGCYLKGGNGEKAAVLLLKASGRRSAEQLEAIVRQALLARPGAALSRTLVAALQRAAQVWIAEGEAARAYRLAADAAHWSLAVPIARDHLPPSPELAAEIARAGALDVAAELYQKLGDKRQEALLRADHALGRDQLAEAARWFEKAEEWGSAAEQWAASGELGRAAELYERSGELRTAAQLYARSGEAEKERALLARLEGSDAATSMDFARTHPNPLADAPSPAGSGRSSAGVPVSSGALDPGERYVLAEVLGRGGMGVVYRATDRTLQREVAYKVLSVEAADAAEGESLLAEARAAAKLSHPNIVQVFDAGHDARGYFIVMELVTGETIQALLKRQRFTIPGAIFLARQICAALAHAHERRIIHRDLKPSNLLWTAEKRLKLTDFGLARAFEAESAQVMTRAAGTPFYMAPEQIRGEPVSPQTDLYALGCVLYELLCGRSPFAGGSSIYHHLNTPPKSPAECRPEVSEQLAEIILRCLEKDPANRPSSAAQVARELAALG